MWIKAQINLYKCGKVNTDSYKFGRLNIGKGIQLKMGINLQEER